MQKIYLIITNSGDGSNGLLFVKSEEALAKARAEADKGSEIYASGDGLQLKAMEFPDEFDVDGWVEQNFYGYSDEEILEDFE